MKTLYLVIAISAFLSLSSIGAQNPLRPDALSFKALFLDYQSPITGNYGNLRNYKNGFEVSYQRNINDYINVSVPLRAGVVNFNDEFKNDAILSIGAQIHGQLWKAGAQAVPYLLTGAHAVYERQAGSIGVEIPVGIGVDVKMGKNAYFNVQLEYHLGLEDNRNNLQHGVGFRYLIGKKSVAPEVPLKPTDFDGDGIPDEEDLCPDIAGLVEFKGCPDTDGDGIMDAEDQCPDFAGTVELNGCPDSDGDGVSDNEDECPSLKGTIENNGCPVVDQDGDGVLDSDDACPDTPGSIATRGCPDSDSDGVADSDDLCPNDAGFKQFNGCPDRDGDGVHDGIDRCPGTIGLASNNGCPVVRREVKELLDFAQRAVQFDVGKASLRPESIPVLNQIVDILGRYEDYGLAISGHTDATGDTYKNLSLSESRAKACYDYLISRGVSEDRLSYVGFGETRPIATNATDEGRRLNRRVEFEIKFK
ncbi:MAG: OmpA family protein [Saprospiraceae bacterium]|nr:OmpA family protein [Saprospiraceae bacterium]